jgi:CDP-4-dehydro-6-deoxyglucose reductase
MYKVTLNNGVEFNCNSDTTVFDAAKNSGIVLDHSCLRARCRSCIVHMRIGETIDKLDDMVLSSQEKADNWILTCNAIPKTDLVLDATGVERVNFFQKKIVPAKISSIKRIGQTVVEVVLRLPPNSNFRYVSGQYVIISKGQLSRSYSLANAWDNKGFVTFFIRKFKNGLMSNYWFDEAKVDDLVRLEGPLGSFVLRDSSVSNVIFLATGTGIGPIKAILESILTMGKDFTDKKYWLFIGAREESEIIWSPGSYLADKLNLKYVPVMSKGSTDWSGERGYVQDAVINLKVSLSDSHVYACGSELMIQSAMKTLLKNGLKREHFFSDAFLVSN